MWFVSSSDFNKTFFILELSHHFYFRFSRFKICFICGFSLLLVNVQLKCFKILINSFVGSRRRIAWELILIGPWLRVRRFSSTSCSWRLPATCRRWWGHSGAWCMLSRRASWQMCRAEIYRQSSTSRRSRCSCWWFHRRCCCCSYNCCCSLRHLISSAGCSCDSWWFLELQLRPPASASCSPSLHQEAVSDLLTEQRKPGKGSGR